MKRKAIAAVALLMAMPAAADEALRVPAGAAEAAAAGGLSLSLAPQAVLRALKAVGRAPVADGCAVGQCAPGDQACRQNVFHAVLGCLDDGRLAALPDCADCPAPGAGTTLFRAHGGGVTLYGAIGPQRAVGPRLLHAIGRAVEAPPLLNFAPAEGGPP